MKGWFASCIAVLGLVLLVGCGFNSRSAQFTCESETDCEVGRICEQGWCVVPPADIPDANDVADASLVDAAIIDAAPPDAVIADAGPPDAFPLGPCNSCQNDTCREECSDTDCSLDCTKNNCSCEFQCSASAANCDMTCKEGTASCDVDCAGAASCKTTCETNTVCNINCTDVTACGEAKCELGAMCLLDCTGAGTCEFEVCAGAETSCPNNVIACNRACP